ncbi:hypothetical protein GPZ81_31950 [Burkholderia pseudomallei]|nr:hypothetical protein EGY14_02565 [Burkholderia pseudomallei]PNW93628.1 hypothetical protein CF649_34770 [Burkholderia sp. 136(2017)]PNX12118.1 hypothetical protein CF650_25575 [Burkholderia sp. 129]PNX28768.1 hypothetical protein CF647_17625 [Burkholderia sp. 117]PNX30542.1 hypothetical protein CF648_34430 [Burkholderia sp. 137]
MKCIGGASRRRACVPYFIGPSAKRRRPARALAAPRQAVRRRRAALRRPPARIRQPNRAAAALKDCYTLAQFRFPAGNLCLSAPIVRASRTHLPSPAGHGFFNRPARAP